MTPTEFNNWLDALRSDAYAQGRSALMRDTPGAPPTFCCLGVWAYVNDPERLTPDGQHRRSYQGNAHYLPDTIIDRVTQSHLAEMNDQEHKTFAEIADYLETQRYRIAPTPTPTDEAPEI